jgi:hypothetical protein
MDPQAVSHIAITGMIKVIIRMLTYRMSVLAVGWVFLVVREWSIVLLFTQR